MTSVQHAALLLQQTPRAVPALRFGDRDCERKPLSAHDKTDQMRSGPGQALACPILFISTSLHDKLYI